MLGIILWRMRRVMLPSAVQQLSCSHAEAVTLVSYGFKTGG